MIKAIMNINSFWISTQPRTGSMWVYNVTREILKFFKLNILPIHVPTNEQETFEIFNKESLIDKNETTRYVFKTHHILKPNLLRSQIITTIRDPRDICISYKEFMRTDFDKALESTKSILKFEKIYKTFNKDFLKFIRYEDIENKPIEIILEIAKFIGYKISYKNAEDISIKYEKKKVQDLIKKNDEDLLSKIKNKEKIDESSIIRISKDNYRSFDTNTGFQTNHISNRNSGDWKKYFSQKEIEILNFEFKDFISEYKF